MLWQKGNAMALIQKRFYNDGSNLFLSASEQMRRLFGVKKPSSEMIQLDCRLLNCAIVPAPEYSEATRSIIDLFLEKESKKESNIQEGVYSLFDQTVYLLRQGPLKYGFFGYISEDGQEYELSSEEMAEKIESLCIATLRRFLNWSASGMCSDPNATILTLLIDQAAARAFEGDEFALDLFNTLRIPLRKLLGHLSLQNIPVFTPEVMFAFFNGPPH
jgi:hypothetical protein